MAIDFPTAPALNDTYTYQGKTYSFNGDGWVGVAATFGSGVAAKIRDIRAASNVLEPAPPADYQDNRHWPV